MTYLLNPAPPANGGDHLFRYGVDPSDAQRWDPETRTWVDLPWPNIVSDEVNRGSYGMSTPPLSEVARITAGNF